MKSGNNPLNIKLRSKSFFPFIFALAVPGFGNAEGCGTLLAALDGSGAYPDATCGEGQTQDGPLRYCQIEYGYRDNAANERFAAMAGLIRQCIPGAIERPPPNGVNHPDTHLVHIFDVDGGKITVSLKDKSQLQKTFVFLQVTPQNARQ